MYYGSFDGYFSKCHYSFQIAKLGEVNRFGLVFGCNMFASLVLQTILTAIVVDENALGLSAKKQVRINHQCFFLMNIDD